MLDSDCSLNLPVLSFLQKGSRLRDISDGRLLCLAESYSHVCNSLDLRPVRGRSRRNRWSNRLLESDSRVPNLLAVLLQTALALLLIIRHRERYAVYGVQFSERQSGVVGQPLLVATLLILLGILGHADHLGHGHGIQAAESLRHHTSVCEFEG